MFHAKAQRALSFASSFLCFFAPLREIKFTISAPIDGSRARRWRFQPCLSQLVRGPTTAIQECHVRVKRSARNPATTLLSKCQPRNDVCLLHDTWRQSPAPSQDPNLLLVV